jgi:hypothetical protein
MFITLLLVSFVLSVVVCVVVARTFQTPIVGILKRLVSDDIYSAWHRYITFAIYVVGISGGVRVWDLERYISPSAKGAEILQLTRDRWILEVYRTIIGTLQSIAWMLLVFFLFALVAYVIVKAFEMKRDLRS